MLRTHPEGTPLKVRFDRPVRLDRLAFAACSIAIVPTMAVAATCASFDGTSVTLTAPGGGSDSAALSVSLAAGDQVCASFVVGAGSGFSTVLRLNDGGGAANGSDGGVLSRTAAAAATTVTVELLGGPGDSATVTFATECGGSGGAGAGGGVADPGGRDVAGLIFTAIEQNAGGSDGPGGRGIETGDALRRFAEGAAPNSAIGSYRRPDDLELDDVFVGLSSETAAGLRDQLATYSRLRSQMVADIETLERLRTRFSITGQNSTEGLFVGERRALQHAKSIISWYGLEELRQLNLTPASLIDVVIAILEINMGDRSGPDGLDNYAILTLNVIYFRRADFPDGATYVPTLTEIGILDARDAVRSGSAELIQAIPASVAAGATLHDDLATLLVATDIAVAATGAVGGDGPLLDAVDAWADAFVAKQASADVAVNPGQLAAAMRAYRGDGLSAAEAVIVAQALADRGYDADVVDLVRGVYDGSIEIVGADGSYRRVGGAAPDAPLFQPSTFGPIAGGGPTTDSDPLQGAAMLIDAIGGALRGGALDGLGLGPFNVWTSYGFSDFENSRLVDGAISQDGHSHTVTFGADAALAEGWRGGAAFSVSRSEFDAPARGGREEETVYTISPFATVDVIGGARLTIAGGYGFGEVETSRSGGSIVGSSDVRMVFGSARLSRSWRPLADRPFVLGASFGASVSRKTRDAYVESDGSAVSEATSYSSAIAPELSAEYAFDFDGLTLTPFASAGYSHDFSAAVNGDRGSIDLAGGLRAAHPSGLSLQVTGETQLGVEDYRRYGFEARLSYAAPGASNADDLTFAPFADVSMDGVGAGEAVPAVAVGARAAAFGDAMTADVSARRTFAGDGVFAIDGAVRF